MPVLLLAAHGTRSAAGRATTERLVEAVRAARPSLTVDLCFLDVLSPTLSDALDRLAPAQVVVVPLLLSAGYHVSTDIPRTVAGRPSVRVARHLGPDPLIVEAVADRLAEVSDGAWTVLLAAVGSSRESARQEVRTAASRLSARLGVEVLPLPLDGDVGAALAARPGPVAIATYLLAEGDFLDKVREASPGVAVVADPIDSHPALVRLVLARYDEAVSALFSGAAEGSGL
jgi:sirohydrochlorin ferrochelatase